MQFRRSGGRLPAQPVLTFHYCLYERCGSRTASARPAVWEMGITAFPERPKPLQRAASAAHRVNEGLTHNNALHRKDTPRPHGDNTDAVSGDALPAATPRGRAEARRGGRVAPAQRAARPGQAPVWRLTPVSDTAAPGALPAPLEQRWNSVL